VSENLTWANGWIDSRQQRTALKDEFNQRRGKSPQKYAGFCITLPQKINSMRSLYKQGRGIPQPYK
jgi:hypothetical protein